LRRHDYELKNYSLLGLLADCVYYCWQHEQITDEEELKLTNLIEKMYEKEQSIKEVENEQR
jgi:hypothetical protein